MKQLKRVGWWSGIILLLGAGVIGDHSALSLSVSVDADGDGWIDGVETNLGSNPNDAASTPEDVATPPSCLDGVDNDGDGTTDLADSGCAPATVFDTGFPSSAGVDRFDSSLTLTGYSLATTSFGTCTVDFDGRGPVVVSRSAPSGGAIDTEIVAMQLTGTATVQSGGTCTIPAGDYDVTMFEDPDRASVGNVQRKGASDYPADSFFDVFFKLDTPVGVLDGGPPGGPVGDAIHVTNTVNSLPPYNTADNPNCYAVQGLPHKHCPKAPPDHFKCYRAKFPKFQRREVTLLDQFGQGQSVVLKPLYFCNPASKNAEPLYQEAAHLTCYATRPKGAKRNREPTHTVVVRNQFGEETVKIKPIHDERLLCLPSKKDDLPQPVAADHFKCYAGKFPKFTERKVSLVDQFGTEQATVRRPAFLCNPVSKNGEGINDRLNHLKCYKLKPQRTPRTVTVTNQFVDAASVTTKKSDLLCVPSSKTEVSSTTTTTVSATTSTTTTTTLCLQPPCTGRAVATQSGDLCLERTQGGCVANPDVCQGYHLHGSVSVDGGQPIPDPNPGSCGHGLIVIVPTCGQDTVPHC